MTPSSACVLGDLSRRGEPVDVGHADVHQHDVGPLAAGELDRLGAVGRLADDLDVVLGVEQGPEPAAYEHLIVGEEDLDHWRPFQVATTSKPPSRRGPVHSSPPVDSTRSRMPTRPNPIEDPLVCGP